MSLNEGAKKRVIVDSELSDELEVNVKMHQGSVLLPFLFAVVVLRCHRICQRVR